ncbi:MAG: hypothetical protein K5889_02565 [Lachnospiraceae bacterium]|nr:hypothetical protein [Lachnospiraceae bacterium]
MRRNRKHIVIGIMLCICLLFGYGSFSFEAYSVGAFLANEQVVEAKTTYKSIYTSYTKKLKKQAPKLAKQYKKKIKNVTSISDKATLYQEYVKKLAAIQVKGG